ncbi:glycoside hydrolase family 2 protein [Mucilaginibacter arboris]|uniref:DUF4982 domain-containing protein n=1 Tax=Mucilaginibacter arboris TaxID=2682090 RepID=A0A7K1SVX4_9SPHI|nr:glycoside hydrolase family 2 TIM barrel-domain containing protein [Mucilaginibacter arboris]MVN21443.1 DUF4982 domain-containing protein [Mucilaginibacter arboris]
MKKTLICLLLSVTAIFKAEAQKTPSATNFNQGWQFVKDIDTTNSGTKLSTIKTASVVWENVSLPHTPQLEPVKKVKEQWQGTCFYRKFFTVPAADKGRHIAIQFDAAMHEADIYVNGKHVFKHIGGYLPFYMDVSDVVKYGRQNCILVKLNNQDNAAIPPGKPIKDLDFNYYGGLYRNAWLIKKNKLYISNSVQAQREAGGGVLVHEEAVSDKSAKLIIKTDLNNDFKAVKEASVKLSLIDDAGKTVAAISSKAQAIPAAGHAVFEQHLTVENPKLWSPSHPYLYQLKIQVLQNGKEIDATAFQTGIRTVKFEKGEFYLNGEKLTIVGTNRHQEYPYIGYALSDNAQFRDAWKIKDAGFNFVRCSHYPPSPAFLDACDQLGILVMDATPGWQFFGGKEFQENSFQNIRDMIRRDRNHPAIVLWEASLNETNMSKAYMDTANKIAHEELPFTGVYTTGWMDYAYDVFNPARQHLKAPDYWKKYNKPKPLLIAEYGDWEYYAQNAGFNQKEYAGLKSEERNSRQTRADGQQRLLQQALNFQEAHNDNLYGPGFGDVNWLMFDYKRGYAADLETSGISDIFRVPKFSFYFYQSQNGPVADVHGFGKPMLFIANYWNDPAQKTVKIFSNCDQVELFLNGKSLGKQKPDTGMFSNNLKHPPFTFHPASFTTGKLTAVGYLNGKQAATATQATPVGTPSKIVIKADESGKSWTAGSKDALFFYAYLTDENGTLVPTSSNKVKISVKGNAQIMGNAMVDAEAGIASFLLQAGDKPGTVEITATADNLKPGTLIYKVH